MGISLSKAVAEQEVCQWAIEFNNNALTYTPQHFDNNEAAELGQGVKLGGPVGISAFKSNETEELPATKKVDHIFREYKSELDLNEITKVVGGLGVAAPILNATGKIERLKN